MYLDLTNDDSELLIQYSPREAELLGLVAGLQRKGSYFSAPKSLSIALQLRALFGDKLDSSDKVLKWGISEREKREYRATETIQSGLLLPYQVKGASWLTRVNNAILGYPPGTGKTLISLFGASTEHLFPALIICPNSLKRNWANECAKWYPDLKVTVLDGTAAKRKKLLQEESDIYVVNYEGLASLSIVGRYGTMAVERKNTALNDKEWKTIICDEAHRLVNPKAKSTRCVKELSRGESVENRWALTGTPIRNNPADLWSLLNFLEPSVWTSKSKFLDMFCETSFNIWGGTEVIGIKKDRKALFDSIVDLYLDTVVKEEVLPDLPAKTFSTRYIQMKPKQAKQYKAMVDEMIIKTEEGGYIVATSPLTALTRLSQAAAASLVVVGDEVELETPSCKVDAVVELAEDMGEEQFVVAGVSKKLINLCADKLRALDYKVVLITGDQTTEERDYNVKAFQEGRAQICLMTVAAGGEGITLTAANTLVFVQIPWSNIQYQQVQDRIHRIGSTGDHVQIIHIITEETVEEKQRDAIDRKDGFLQDLLGSREVVGRWLTS